MQYRADGTSLDKSEQVCIGKLIVMDTRCPKLGKGSCKRARKSPLMESSPSKACNTLEYVQSHKDWTPSSIQVYTATETIGLCLQRQDPWTRAKFTISLFFNC